MSKVVLGTVAVLVMVFFNSRTSFSILERHSVPLGDRSVLSCPLDERATDIEWLRNGETYGQTAFLGYGIAQLEEATTSLNGTIFECFAVYDDETRPVAVKSWVVIVKEPPTVSPSVEVSENGSYIISFHLEETTDAGHTFFHLKVPDSNVSHILNVTQYRLPASVCSQDQCNNCSVFISAQNEFGLGATVEVLLRPALDCIEAAERSNSSEDVTSALDAALDASRTPFPINISKSEQDLEGVMAGIIVGAAMLMVLLVLVVVLIAIGCYCHWRRPSRKGHNLHCGDQAKIPETQIVNKNDVPVTYLPVRVHGKDEVCTNRRSGVIPKNNLRGLGSLGNEDGLMKGSVQMQNFQNVFGSGTLESPTLHMPQHMSTPCRSKTNVLPNKDVSTAASPSSSHSHVPMTLPPSGDANDSKSALLGGDTSHDEQAPSCPTQVSYQEQSGIFVYVGTQGHHHSRTNSNTIITCTLATD